MLAAGHHLVPRRPYRSAGLSEPSHRDRSGPDLVSRRSAPRLAPPRQGFGGTPSLAWGVSTSYTARRRDDKCSCEFGKGCRQGWPSRRQRRPFQRLWHRAPDRRWVFWQDQQDEQSCARYFSSALSETRKVDIELSWPTDSTVRVVVPEVDLVWTANLTATPVTRVLNAMGRAMPDRAWRDRPVLTAMGPIAVSRFGRGRSAWLAVNVGGVASTTTSR